jgi:hypothetical protein
LKKERLLKIPILCVLAIGLAICAGCGAPSPTSYAGCELGPARNVVVAAVERMGGYDTWKKVSRITAAAVVTQFDSDSLSFTSRQQLSINLKWGFIAARSRGGKGFWDALVFDGGKGVVIAHGLKLDAQAKQDIKDTLATILHSTRGALNMLGPERPLSAHLVREVGQDLVRVSVEGGKNSAQAYYFDPATHQLRFVTFAADTPGESGTVAVYHYQRLPQGTEFPMRIEVFQLGQSVLIGQKRLLEVEFSEIIGL